MSQGQFISNKWIHGTGPELVSTDPVTGEVVWTGSTARPDQIDAAVAAARVAAADWAELELSQRREILERFAGLQCQPSDGQHAKSEADQLTTETDAPRWLHRREDGQQGQQRDADHRQMDDQDVGGESEDRVHGGIA